MQAMLDKYSSNFPLVTKDSNSAVDNKAVVVITGSTGSLGSYLLHHLLARPEVSKIYCLNRSQDAEQRQRETNAVRGLSHNWTAEQVQFFQVDLSEPRFKLEAQIFDRLCKEVTYVIRKY
jgi:thioester reductase-like protein